MSKPPESAATWSARLTPQEIARRSIDVIAQGLFDDEKAVFIHDLDRMRDRVVSLQSAFPPNALHAVAVKANPVVEVLRALVNAGAGLECASIEEVHLSLAAGCQPSRIVFDSPAKTVAELRFSLEHGLHLNLDNFAELDRVAALLEEDALFESRGSIGIRINPQVGSGTISLTSVAHRISKFGVPLASCREQLLDAYARYSWLDALHVHVGSQGCNIEQLVRGATELVAFRDQAESRRGEAITELDIGGGLPVRYRASDDPPDLVDYVRRLREQAPGLFRDDARIVTELGRSIQASCGWALSRIEYLKQIEDETMVVIHLGGDAFMRPVYAPNDWSHDFILLDERGSLREDGDETAVTVVGPLCFGGDILARGRPLKRPRAADLVVIRDAGAYTLSTWSRHCSRGLPTVVGWSTDGCRVLKRREDPLDVVEFWS